MPGNLSLITNIQTQLTVLQIDINNLNQAVAEQGGALISTTSLQSDLNTVVSTINTAAALAANNTIVGNQ